MSLRLKVSLLILLPMTIILVLASTIAYYQQRNRSLSSMSLLASQTGQVIEHALREDMLLSDFERIQATLDTIASDDRIRTLYLIDTKGRVVFAPEGEGVGQMLDNTTAECLPCHQLPDDQRPSGVVVRSSDGRTVFRSMHPIENRPECNRCHDPSQDLIGVLLTDLSIAPIEAALASDLRTNLAWWIGALLLTALLANLAVNRWVLRRLSQLASAMETFGHKGTRGKLPEEPADEIGRLSSAFNAMAHQVESREKENKALSSELVARAEEKGMLLKRLIDAQEDERKRVARELHDDLGASLGSTALMIELARRALHGDEDSARANLEQARDLISETSDKMYEIILGLRPSVLDDLGLMAALRSYAHRLFDQEDIQFELRSQGLGERLAPEIETVLFRVLQEALTNVHRHAKAKQVSVSLSKGATMITGEIRDDGVGFDSSSPQPDDQPQRGLGLMGMRERAEQCGGRLLIDACPGGGTCVRIEIPLPEVLNVQDH